MVKKTVCACLALILLLQLGGYALGLDITETRNDSNAFNAAVILQAIVGLKDNDQKYTTMDAAWLLSQSGTEAEPSVPPKEHHDPDEGEWDIIL